MLRVLVGATGDCFSYINLSDLILSSFWTSDPQQDESATLDSQPGCGGFTWALSSCSGRCYISSLPGTCHLQASYPLGLQINSHSLCPSVARSDSSLWCSSQERWLWFIYQLYRILSETGHPPEGKPCFLRWWALELAKKWYNFYFWVFYSFLNILSIWFTCLTRKELSQYFHRSICNSYKIPFIGGHSYFRAHSSVCETRACFLSVHYLEFFTTEFLYHFLVQSVHPMRFSCKDFLTNYFPHFEWHCKKLLLEFLPLPRSLVNALNCMGRSVGKTDNLSLFPSYSQWCELFSSPYTF